MMRRIFTPGIVLSVAAALLIFGTPARAQSDQEVAATVKALARTQWAAEIAGQPIAEQMKDVADEYTQFSPGFPVRIDGKALNSQIGEIANGGTGGFVSGEMANEKVQVYGDVAILSYNFVGQTKDKDGVVEPNVAKSTRVYVKKGSRWLLVHANFAPIGE